MLTLSVANMVTGLPPLKIAQTLTVRQLFLEYLDLFGRPTKHLLNFIARSLAFPEKEKLIQIISDPVRLILSHSSQGLLYYDNSMIMTLVFACNAYNV